MVHFTQDQKLTSPNNSYFTSFSSSVTNVSTTCLDFPDCGFKKSESGVTMSCLNCFMGNGSLYRFKYGVNQCVFIAKFRSGVCTTAKSDNSEAVIHRAIYLLHNGFGNYDLFTNNCEDFALYCKTGLVVCSRGQNDLGCSGQAASAVGVPVAAAVGVPVAAILSLPLRLFIPSPVVWGAATAVNYTLNRYATDIGVRSDTLKVEVEDIAAPNRDTRRRKRQRRDLMESATS